MEAESGHAGVIRIDYPGYISEETLEGISWEQFFEAFENDKLASLFQDTLEGGETRRFSKINRSRFD